MRGLEQGPFLREVTPAKGESDPGKLDLGMLEPGTYELELLHRLDGGWNLGHIDIPTKKKLRIEVQESGDAKPATVDFR